MIVAGFGFRAAATPASLRAAYDRVRDGLQAQALATAADKSDNPTFAAFATELGLPVLAISPAMMTQQTTATHSAASQAARGTGSVAEAAALAAAGHGATLLRRRQISPDRMATCALAKGVTP